MELTLILFLAFIVVVFSILRAFGNVVGAGGNLSKTLSEVQERQQINDETARNNPISQIFRTIGGVLFGVLLLSPILYGERVNGEPFISINHQIRVYLVSFLVLTEVLVFSIIWMIDRKPQK